MNDSTQQNPTRFVCLAYDIPRSGKLANPSWFLRVRGAIRLSESVWILEETRILAVPMDDWRLKGATVDVIRYDERDSAVIVAKARVQIENDLDAMVEELKAGTRRLRVQVARLEPGEEKKLDLIRNFASRTLRKASRTADAAYEAALSFQFIGNVASLIDGLRKLRTDSGPLYVALVEQGKAAVDGVQELQAQKEGAA